MAKGIKGITVEIGGNTAPLDKALDGVNKRSRSLQVELRQVEKLLKLDPTNTELLAQKQQLLSKSVKETEEKLNALKAAQQQVQAQFEKGEISEEQYRAFQREIIKTENELNNIKGTLQVATRNLEDFGDNNGVAKKETEQLAKSVEEQNKALEAEKEALKQAEEAQKQHTKEVEDAKKELDEYKDKLKDSSNAVGAGIAAIGASTIAGAGYAVKLSSDFDKAFNTLVTKTGASKDEFDSLNEAMENVYKNNFGESIEDVAQSMAIVKVNTNLVGNELQVATENALLLRDTFEFEVNESTRSAKMLMDQYGMSADEAFNLIAQGAQAGLDKNGDLLDTINEYAVHFKQLGIDADEMFNMLVNGAADGTFSVDKLGDAVKEFGIRVKDGTAENAFQQLGLDVDETTAKFGAGGESAKQALTDVTSALFNMNDPIEQNKLGVELFGTQWEDLGVEGVKALMNTQGEIDKTSSALDNINNKKYDDIGSALQGLGRTLQVDIIEPLGDELKPAVEDAISYVQSNAPSIKETLSQVVSKIGEFVSFIVNNGPAIIATLAGIGTAFLVWNVASVIKGVVEGIIAFRKANEAATIAQAAFNVVSMANPIGLIVAAIAGVVVALITFIATNEELRNKIVEVWNNIKDFFSNALSSIGSTISVWIDNIVNWFTTCWSNVSTWTSNTWNTIGNVIQVGIMLIAEIIKAGFILITLPWQFIWENCKGFIIPIWEYIKTFLSSTWESIKSTASTMWDGIKNTISIVVSSISNIISTVWNGIKSVTLIVFNAIASSISSVWNGIKNFIAPIVNSIFSTISNAWNNIKSVTSSVFNSISTTVSSKWNGIKNTISGAINGAKDVVSSAINKIKSFMNFSWSLPKLKMPHFKINGKFSLNPPSVPKLGVEWYKSGGIMTKPTMFGFNGMNAMVGGEAGPEAILPISNLRSYVKEEMMNVVDGLNSTFDYSLFTEAFISAIKQTGMNDPSFNIDGKQLAKTSARHFDEQLNNINNRKNRLGGVL